MITLKQNSFVSRFSKLGDGGLGAGTDPYPNSKGTLLEQGTGVPEIMGRFHATGFRRLDQNSKIWLSNGLSDGLGASSEFGVP